MTVGVLNQWLKRGIWKIPKSNNRGAGAEIPSISKAENLFTQSTIPQSPWGGFSLERKQEQRQQKKKKKPLSSCHGGKCSLRIDRWKRRVQKASDLKVWGGSNFFPYRGGKEARKKERQVAKNGPRGHEAMQQGAKRIISLKKKPRRERKEVILGLVGFFFPRLEKSEGGNFPPE